jgi:hypothetical protein
MCILHRNLSINLTTSTYLHSEILLLHPQQEIQGALVYLAEATEASVMTNRQQWEYHGYYLVGGIPTPLKNSGYNSG